MGWQEELDVAIDMRRQEAFAQAEALLQELLEKYPDQAEIHYQMAWTFDRQGEESAALGYYEKAVTLGLQGESLRGALLGMGSTYRCLGRYREAGDTFERAIAQFPEDKAFPVFLAMTLYNLREHATAMEILLKILAETTADRNIQAYEKAILFYADRLDETWK